MSRAVVPLSRDKKVPLSCCPFVLGQKVSPVPFPFVRCKNPGTNFSVPGKNHYLIGKIKCQKQSKILKKKFKIFNCFTLFSFLSRGWTGIFLDGTGQAVKILSRPFPWQNVKSRPGSFCGKILSLSCCPFVPGLLSLCPAVQEILSRWKLQSMLLSVFT